MPSHLALPTRRMDGLQGIRAIAIGGVLAVHLGLGKGGYLGVTLFFVLSGFLISTLLLSEQDRTGTIQLRSFYRRRVARLVPAGFVAIIVTATVSLCFGWHPGGITVLGAASGLAYVSNWVATIHGDYLGSVNFSWSLAQEEQYYLIAPLVLLRLPAARRQIAGVAALAVAVILATVRAIACLGWPQDFVRHYHNPIFNMDGLLIGTGLALLLNVRAGVPWQRVRALVGVIPVALAAVILAALYLATPLSSAGIALGLPMTTLLAATMILNLTHRPGEAIDRLLGNSVLCWIGDRSYGLYLYQIVIIGTWRELGLSKLAVAAAASITCLAVADLSFRFFETPIRRAVTSRNPDRGSERPREPAQEK